MFEETKYPTSRRNIKVHVLVREKSGRFEMKTAGAELHALKKICVIVVAFCLAVVGKHEA